MDTENFGSKIDENDENLEYLGEDNTPPEEDMNVSIKDASDGEIPPAQSGARREWSKFSDMIVEYNEQGLPHGIWYNFKEGKLIYRYSLKNGLLDGPQILFDENEYPAYIAYANKEKMREFENLDFQEVPPKDKTMDYARQAHQEREKLKPKHDAEIPSSAPLSAKGDDGQS